MAATQPGRPPREPEADTLLQEIYRQLVAIHYPLAEAPRVDQDLHRRTLQRLTALLDYVDDATHSRAG
jgi:hypothetical protein